MSDVPRQLEVCQLCGTPLGDTPIVSAGPWTVDTTRGAVYYDSLPVGMTGSEAKLMQLLVSRPGTVFTKEMILNALDTEAEQKIVDVFVCKLRRKIREAFGKEVSDTIQTVWGRGYTLSLTPVTPKVAPLAPKDRWTPGVKLSVLFAIDRGEMTAEQFCEENGVQPHELEEWRNLSKIGNLKVTSLTDNRRRAKLSGQVLSGELPVVMLNPDAAPVAGGPWETSDD